MLRCALILFLVGVCTCLSTWEIPEGNPLEHISPWMSENWMQYKKVHNKTYESDTDELIRRLYWEDNVRLIKSHNKLYESGESSFDLGENHFSDMAEDEFKKYYLSGLVIPEEELNRPDDLDDSHINVDDLEASFDWTQKKNVVGSVKNQGSCGSCWAFSAAGALEGQIGIKRGVSIDLSEQNLVDCSTNGNHGCFGGWMNRVFDYVYQYGIDSESAYKYRGYKGTCRYREYGSQARVYDIGDVRKGSEYSLQSWVKYYGPMSVAAEVSDTKFMQYKSGVYDNPSCGKYVNHAMLNVGYGTYGSKDYWLIKNSWGTGWGDKGYIKMRRNRSNQCGIASYASFGKIY